MTDARQPPSAPRALAGFTVVTCIAGAVLSGCAGYAAFREGQTNLASGQVEPGLTKLRQAMSESPGNPEFRRTYFTQREASVNALIRSAESSLEAGAFDEARIAFAAAQRLDASNARATSGIARVDAAERHSVMLDDAMALARTGKMDAALSKAQQVVTEAPTLRRANLLLRQLLRQQADASGKELGIHPKLKAAYRVPVSLSFTNATLLQVFESLKQASGLNYMIERDVKPDLRVTLSVTNKAVEDIVRLLLATNQLDRRVLDDDTVLIYPNTPAKAAEYKEMVVRTFYLSNGDATKVANAVRTIAKARDVVVDEKLNMLMVRDSAEVIRLSEKVIASQDLAEAEVMLELEVLEVSVSRLLDLGIRWPDSVSAGVVGADGVMGQLRLNELRNRSRDMVRLNTNDPLISATLRNQKGDANLLANPRIRVRNRQSAKILIGERVPVITTTTTANVGSSQSINYLDVGLKLELEPTISLDDEVSMKIALEVSNILETIKLTGTQSYRLGTRNTSTTLRVRDGETNILAGLIQRDERHSNTGVPGLNELPVLNKLFGASQDSDTRTEIVLLITPRIVRSLDVPGVGMQEFLSGTDAAVGAAPIQFGAPGPGARGSIPTSSPPQIPIPGIAPPANLLRPQPMPVQPGQLPMPSPSGPPSATVPGAPIQFPSPAAAQPTPAAPAASSPPAFVPPPLIPATPGSR